MTQPNEPTTQAGPTTKTGREFTGWRNDSDRPGEQADNVAVVIAIEAEAIANFLRDEKTVAAHTPWARANFDRHALWVACSCGWNMNRDAADTWTDHILAALRESVK